MKPGISPSVHQQVNSIHPSRKECQTGLGRTFITKPKMLAPLSFSENSCNCRKCVGSVIVADAENTFSASPLAVDVFTRVWHWRLQASHPVHVLMGHSPRPLSEPGSWFILGLSSSRALCVRLDFLLNFFQSHFGSRCSVKRETMVLHVFFALFAVPLFALELFSSSGDCESYELTNGTECVTAQGYPSDYSDGSYCEVVIGDVPVSLDVRSFDTEWYWDSLKMTDAASAVTNEYSGACCPLSALSCDWSTSYCDDFVEGLSANSELTWSSDDSVSASGWMICMSEDPDGNYAQVKEDDSASAVATVVVLALLLCGCCACCCLVAVVVVVICSCRNSKSQQNVPGAAAVATPTTATAVVAHATAVTVDPTPVEDNNVQPEDNPDAELPPADDNRPGVGEEDIPDAGLH